MTEKTAETTTAPTGGAPLKETERIRSTGGGPGHGPWGGGMVGQKAMTFGPSAKRLVRRMAPQRVKATAVLLLAVCSVSLFSIGPKVLGHATNLIYEGLVGSRLGERMPVGTTKADAVAALRAAGQDKLADMVASMNVVVGQGVDFSAVGRVLTWVLVIYVGAALLGVAEGELGGVEVERHGGEGGRHTVVEVEGDEASFGLLGRDRGRDEPVTVVAVLIDGVEEPPRLEPDAQEVGVGLEPGDVLVEVGAVGGAVQRDHTEDLPVDAPGRQAHPRDLTGVVDAEQLAIGRGAGGVGGQPDGVTVAGDLPAHALPDGDVQQGLGIRVAREGGADDQLLAVGGQQHRAERVRLAGERLGDRRQVEAAGGAQHPEQRRRHLKMPSRSASAMAPPRSWTSSLR